MNTAVEKDSAMSNAVADIVKMIEANKFLNNVPGPTSIDKMQTKISVKDKIKLFESKRFRPY